MSSHDKQIEALREALNVSPDNVPLRRHLAETLAALGRWGEAEEEYRTVLSHAPNSGDFKLGLAMAFYHQEKNSHAMVVVEELIREPEPGADVRILYARLLFRDGQVERAVVQYKQAVSLDPEAGDEEFEERLGIGVSLEDDDEVVDGRVRMRGESGDFDADEIRMERPKIDFDDVGGMEDLKDEIRMKIIHPLTHPELYEAYGKTAGGGILMYGPPGCGKTHLARATAGEVKAAFLPVGIHDVLDMWIGSSERNLHAIFEQARSHKPCVLFFDEVDALGASRADMRQSGGRQIINQFLDELDGVQASNEGILILAATNTPWHLDSAFRRPGRFDRILFVPPPDAPAREAILRIHTEGKPLGEVDFVQLAKRTEGFSGADLRAVVDVAVESKLREAFKSGAPSPLSTKDLKSAAKRLRPTTKEWFSTARNYALYSNQGGFYDDILRYLGIG